MRTSEALVALGCSAAFLFLLFGCWLMYRRLRTWSSVCLLATTIGIPIWYFVSPVVVQGVIEQARITGRFGDWDWVLVGMTTVLPTSLILAAAISFCLSVRAIDARPNNSFKPNPLRGSA